MTCRVARCYLFANGSSPFCSCHSLKSLTDFNIIRFDCLLIEPFYPKNAARLLTSLLIESETGILSLLTSTYIQSPSNIWQTNFIVPKSPTLVSFLNFFIESLTGRSDRPLVVNVREFVLFGIEFNSRSVTYFAKGMPLLLYQHLLEHCKLLHVIEGKDVKLDDSELKVYDPSGDCALQPYWERRVKKHGLVSTGDISILTQVERTISKVVHDNQNLVDLIVNYAVRF